MRRLRALLGWARHHKLIATVAVVAVFVVIGLMTPPQKKQDTGKASTPVASAQPSPTETPTGAPHAGSATAPQPVSTAPTSAAPPPSNTTTTAPLPAPPTSAATVAQAPSAALQTLASLPVKGRAPKTGYDRAMFGPAWADVDHNGCDTRNDILRRDLVQITYKADDPGCTVASGVLHDPYTGKTIQFIRGSGTSTQVQIDHLVALSDAWQKGAQQWSATKREQFANDPIELLAVAGPTNEAKGDGDAATWLPPNKAYRCTYVSKQVAVKAKYGLWVTQAEHDAIARILAGCGTTPPTVAPTPASVPTVAVTTPPQPAQDTVYYPNCAAVRAAGKAPLHRGDPGYRSGLDRDGDGVACE